MVLPSQIFADCLDLSPLLAAEQFDELIFFGDALYGYGCSHALLRDWFGSFCHVDLLVSLRSDIAPATEQSPDIRANIGKWLQTTATLPLPWSAKSSPLFGVIGRSRPKADVRLVFSLPRRGPQSGSLSGSQHSEFMNKKVA